jgi:PTS system mannose-specific IIA component
MAEMEGTTLIGIVLVTHGALADELRLAMEHVVGPQSSTATVCIGPDDDMEQRRDDILKSVEAVDTGTPSNLAISIMEKPSIEVIAGVNLPMLVKLASIREKLNLQDAVSQARDAGQKYIMIASHVLWGT